MEYCENLQRKLKQYETVSEEFYGLVKMNISDIFKGIAQMKETPERLWTHMSE